MKILLAEDDYASRKFLCKFLNYYGECDVVENGVELVETYINSMNEFKSYDLLCLDIMMPKVDGVKALKAIREWEIRNGLLPNRRVKVILTTALAEGTHISEALEFGCEGYIIKPIDIAKFDELLNTIGILKKV
jgi:two-component system chemotaxis response regulator CheY